MSLLDYQRWKNAKQNLEFLRKRLF